MHTHTHPHIQTDREAVTPQYSILFKVWYTFILANSYTQGGGGLNEFPKISKTGWIRLRMEAKNASG